MTKFEEKVCRAAIKNILGSLSKCHSEDFTDFAIPDRLIDKLSELSFTQQGMFLDRAQTYFSFAINVPEMDKQLEIIDQLRQEKEIEDIYLVQGAPLKLMRRLFGMHASEFSRRRDAMCLKHSGSGRPIRCDEKTDHYLWHLWASHAKLCESERFLKVAEESSLNLHNIWNSLREYIEANDSKAKQTIK
ncbi:MAG: STY4526/YPO1902 family pathogenicity island replication protein [Proteobacteria bacterium]|nr:STY4526/YPO1902 family pathogenicity island replication protein [Pseudomonadota bacterium]